MNQSNYLSKLLGILVVLLSISIYMYSGVSFSISHTNTKQNFIYEGSSSQAALTNYYASESDFIGGANLQLNEAMEIDSIEIVLENDKVIKHQIQKLDDLNYLLNVKKTSQTTLPKQAVLYVQGEVYDVIDLSKKTKELYSFTDGKQTYRHLYFNDTGVFLGEFHLEEMPEDVSEYVMVEFAHKDDKSSTGYHVFAKKRFSLFSFVSGEDLGYVDYLENKNYDFSKDVYVIISWSNGNVVEMPLIKGAN